MITLNTYYTDFYRLKKFISDHRLLFNSPQKKSILVQVFSGICDKIWLESLRTEIRGLLPDATIIGTTTMGEIMNGEVSSLKTAISISLFDSAGLTLIQETRGDATCFELGEAIAEKSRRVNSKVLIMFSTLQERDASEMLRGIAAVDKTLVVAGGCAGSNMETTNGLVISDTEVSDRSVVAVALSGEHLTAKQHWHLCWTPVGKSMTITKAKNARVYSIDNIPAFQLYRKYLGLPNRKSSVISLIFPLLLNRHGVDMVQAPVAVNADDSIDFRINLEEGEKIRFSYGNIEMILDSIDSLIDDIRSQTVDSIFVYSCGWRRAFLQDSAEIETKPLQKLAPTAGFFTNGEFYHVADTNQLLTGTMTTLALSETEATSSEYPADIQLDTPALTAKPSGQVDNLSLKGSEIIKALTKLVERTTMELNAKIAELEEINEKVRFDSMHDGLSGLYNRYFYEQEVQRINGTTGAAGILVGDLDGLKLTNDTLGHGAGDEMIRTVSDIFSIFQAERRSIYRIGGDEFVVLETDGTHAEIDNLRDEIEERIRRYNASSPFMTVSISFGTAFVDSAFGKMQELFAEADGEMYDNKLLRSKAAKEDLARTLIARWRETTFRSAQERRDTIRLAESFARYLKLGAERVLSIASLAEYHDIGEIGIPSASLQKKEALTAKEKTAIERHAEIGFRIAHASRDLITVADYILKHHEWWNGQGYPLGIKGDLIPLECRMMGVVIAYAAMTNDRPYRKAINGTEARAELRMRAGTEFDPDMVKLFISMLDES